MPDPAGVFFLFFMFYLFSQFILISELAHCNFDYYFHVCSFLYGKYISFVFHFGDGLNHKDTPLATVFFFFNGSEEEFWFPMLNDL